MEVFNLFLLPGRVTSVWAQPDCLSLCTACTIIMPHFHVTYRVYRRLEANFDLYNSKAAG